MTRLIQHSKIIDLNKRSTSSSTTVLPLNCEQNIIRQRMRKQESHVHRTNSFVSTRTSFVIYIQMAHSRDFESWLALAKCLKIWDLDPRGYHKGVWRLHFDGFPLIVVGSPHSPFSVFKPSHVQLIVFSRNFTTKRP